MIDLKTKTRYQIKYTSDFKKNYKKIKKQGKRMLRSLSM